MTSSSMMRSEIELAVIGMFYNIKLAMTWQNVLRVTWQSRVGIYFSFIIHLIRFGLCVRLN